MFLILFFSYGQETDKALFKNKVIIVKDAEIQIDTFSINPNYFKITDKNNKSIPKKNYKVDFVNAKLNLLNLDKYKNQKITIYYLIYPEKYRRTYQTFFRHKIISDSLMLPVFTSEEVYKTKPFDGLKTQGNITRGVNVGNNQSLVMQSGLDLKIEGKLSDKIKVKAVLSDDNLPQAYAGISKSYKDFKRIYLQLSGKKWQATGGDLLMNKQTSRFLKFQRKTQGLDFTAGNKSKFNFAIGIVDGQYNRMQFNGIDGNQGPYLLKGKHGETYVFVVPASEKVYINGNLLQPEKDYTIRYETGELIFNPNVPITANQRISVTFNYSNQNYVRYLNYNSFTQTNEQSDFKIYSYIEQDNKFKTLLFDLTPEQVNALKNAGDNPHQLYVISAKETSFSPNKILYKKIVSGSTNYFEYTQQDEPNLFSVRFSFVGKNKGSYKIDKVTAIGKIYKFVGQYMGDYEPVIKLTPAVAKQYLGTKIHSKIGAKTDFNSEMILSNTDKNLFSSKDDNDNIGGALHLNFNTDISKDSIQKLSVFGQYDYIHKNFTALDPYYDVEFNRRWQIDSIFGKQHLVDVGVAYDKKMSHLISGLRYYQLRDTLRAEQFYVEGNQHFNKVNWVATNRYTLQKTPKTKMLMLDLDNKFNVKLKKMDWLNTIHFEKRSKEQSANLDTLNYTYKYIESKISKRDSSKMGFTTGFRLTENDSIRFNHFNKASREIRLFAGFHRNYKTGKIALFSNYRKSLSFFQNRNRNYLNINADWKQYLYKKVFLSKLNLTTFNGNILQDEWLFVETPPGQGNYQWNDYNNNGIKEINEFEIAVFSDQANYIRVVLPSQKLIPTQNNAYSWQFVINPSAYFKKSFVKHFYNVFKLKTNYQIVQNNRFLSFQWQPDNPILFNSVLQNDLFLNRSRKKYFVHIGLQKMTNEHLLVVGKQTRQIERLFVETRHEFIRYLKWTQNLSTSINKEVSENYASKNFELRNKQIEEAVHYFKVKKYEIKLYYQFKNKENLSGNENLKMQKIGLQYTGFPQKKYSFYTRFNFVYNQFSGNSHSPVAFQMLEGLQKGKNIIYEFNLRQKLTSYLEMNLNYNLRLSEQNPAVHVGGIQLRMLF